MSVTDTSKSEINYFARRNSLFQRSSRNMLAASWLNTSGKRRCSLKRCMHFIHGSHGLERVSSSSLQPLPLASSLAPRHVPRTSPPPSPNATSTSQRHPSLRAQTSPPCPPLPPSASPCITVRPRRRRMLQPETETSYSQSYRASTLPEPTTAEESDTEETRTKTSGGVSFDRDAREACHKHMAQRTALRTISYSPASQATPHTVNMRVSRTRLTYSHATGVTRKSSKHNTTRAYVGGRV